MYIVEARRMSSEYIDSHQQSCHHGINNPFWGGGRKCWKAAVVTGKAKSSSCASYSCFLISKCWDLWCSLLPDCYMMIVALANQLDIKYQSNIKSVNRWWHYFNKGLILIKSVPLSLEILVAPKIQANSPLKAYDWLFLWSVKFVNKCHFVVRRYL